MSDTSAPDTISSEIKRWVSSEIRRWVAAETGIDDVELTRLPGGGRHQAWRVQPIDPADERHWFLRLDAAAPSTREHYTLRREADVYRAAHAAGAPVPEVIGVHPELEAVLLEHVPGEARFGDLEPAVQQPILDDLAAHLARLHAVDPASLPLGSLAPVESLDEHVLAEIDIWQTRLDDTGLPRPFYTAAFRWLREHQPAVARRPALVQGDTGPGNFLHDGRRVTAILDFELGHLGDPLEDLAWVGTRNVQEPVPDFDLFCERYVAAGGEPIDPVRLRYHLLFAELRIAVLYVDRESYGLDPREDLGNQLIYRALHSRVTVEAMAAAHGAELPSIDIDAEPAPTTNSPFHDALLEQLRTIVVPAVADPFAARRAKGMARIIKHLDRADRYGDAPRQAELGHLTLLLGSEPATVEDGRRAVDDLVRTGRLDVVDLLPYAWAHASWLTALARPAMGALATTHHPIIRR